jgi:DNA-binding NtrC family response regulator
MATILVVDDELGIRGLLSEILSDEGHTVELAENAAQARAARERQRPDLVLLDIWMPDVDGITLLKEWGGAGLLNMPVVMMSGHGTIDTAVEATKHGAMAFLEKPITLAKLLRAVDQALQRSAPRPAATATAAVAAPVNSWSRVEGSAPIPVTYGPASTASFNSPSHHSGPAPEQVFDLDRPLREARDAFERSYFEFHLARENGSMTRVAEKTGLERTHLYRKLKQLGVDIGRAKRNA